MGAPGIAINTAYLRELREAAGWSQAETARQLGINQSYYSQIERGKRRPSKATLQRISDAYRIWPALLQVVS